MRTIRRRDRGGYALAAVLLFLAMTFAAWAVLFRGSASILRTEQARAMREFRNTWTAAAMAKGLRLLETGRPGTSPYVGKTSVTQDDQTRYFLLTFERLTGNRWTVHCAPTTVDDPTPNCLAAFPSNSNGIGNGGGGNSGGGGGNN